MMQKDLRQAWEVALAVCRDDALSAKSKGLYDSLLPSWKTTIMNKSVPLIQEHVVRDREKIDGILARIGVVRK